MKLKKKAINEMKSNSNSSDEDTGYKELTHKREKQKQVDMIK